MKPRPGVSTSHRSFSMSNPAKAHRRIRYRPTVIRPIGVNDGLLQQGAFEHDDGAGAGVEGLFEQTQLHGGGKPRASIVGGPSGFPRALAGIKHPGAGKRGDLPLPLTVCRFGKPPVENCSGEYTMEA